MKTIFSWEHAYEPRCRNQRFLKIEQHVHKGVPIFKINCGRTPFFGESWDGLELVELDGKPYIADQERALAYIKYAVAVLPKRDRELLQQAMEIVQPGHILDEEEAA